MQQTVRKLPVKRRNRLCIATILWLCTLGGLLRVEAQAVKHNGNITLSLSNVPLITVFDQIQKQSSYRVLYNSDLVKSVGNVSISVQHAGISTVMNKCLSGKPLQYSIDGSSVIISYRPDKNNKPDEKETDSLVTGRVISETTEMPLVGATVVWKGTNTGTLTDATGTFHISKIRGFDTLIISYIGYKTKKVAASTAKAMNTIMQRNNASLSAVTVSTGYQQIPKERATGSFVQLSNAEINRSVSTNITDRLDGLVSGMQFSEYNASTSYLPTTNPIQRTSGLMIRGKSTLNVQVNANPLIILDNFPYDGDISNINPNDVESVTVLKDAAASSIWGARAGNGVVVITTKKGKLNQPLTVQVNSSVTVQDKPDLNYDRDFLNSSDYIDVETYLFNQGYFDYSLNNTSYQTPVSPVIDILAEKKAGTLTKQEADNKIDALRSIDVRKQWSKYFYQKAVRQQYSVNVSGGTNNMTNTLSVGYDRNTDNLRRNGFNRVTINTFNTYRPVRNLRVTAGVNYVQSSVITDNRIGYQNIGIGGNYAGLYPYAQFADANGNPLSIVKDYRASYADNAESSGFLDWNYRPMEELALADDEVHNKDILLRVSVKYDFTSYLNLELMYQNETQKISTYNYQTQKTYYTRNLINKFTVFDAGNTIYYFPKGGILNTGEDDWNTNNARAQLSFDKTFNQKHNITAIAGAEIKQLKTEGTSQTFYGYNGQFGTSNNTLNYTTSYPTNPAGSSWLPSPSDNVSGVLNRFVSFFANAAYNYNNLYTVTISARKDGANLFGVKTNNKITPLWSAGLGWSTSNEKFYNLEALPYIKLRLSYGVNGNIYNGSAYSKGRYSTDDFTGLPDINNITAANPELHWEKIKTKNIGLDFATKNNILSGSIEYYIKNGTDLIEPVSLAPSTGFTSFYGNAAGTMNRGFDISLKSMNINRAFRWNSILIFSTLHSKLTKWDAPLTSSINTADIHFVGYPMYSVFSYRWAGLDPSNGDPQGYLDGKPSTDYSGIINNYNIDSLVYNGPSMPTVYGSLINEFTYKGVSLSFNIFYEFGFYFRRASISGNYNDMIGLYGNEDYDNSWKNPGDEKHTNTPSLVYPSNYNRGKFYQYSDALVNSGSNIRLHDIRLAYNFKTMKWKGIKLLNLYLYAKNLGILWRANKYSLDPDLFNGFSSHDLPIPVSVSAGLNVTF